MSTSLNVQTAHNYLDCQIKSRHGAHLLQNSVNVCDLMSKLAAYNTLFNGRLLHVSDCVAAMSFCLLVMHSLFCICGE